MFKNPMDSNKDDAIIKSIDNRTVSISKIPTPATIMFDCHGLTPPFIYAGDRKIFFRNEDGHHFYDGDTYCSNFTTVSGGYKVLIRVGEYNRIGIAKDTIHWGPAARSEGMNIETEWSLYDVNRFKVYQGDRLNVQ